MRIIKYENNTIYYTIDDTEHNIPLTQETLSSLSRLDKQKLKSMMIKSRNTKDITKLGCVANPIIDKAISEFFQDVMDVAMLYSGWDGVGPYPCKYGIKHNKTEYDIIYEIMTRLDKISGSCLRDLAMELRLEKLEEELSNGKLLSHDNLVKECYKCWKNITGKPWYSVEWFLRNVGEEVEM